MLGYYVGNEDWKIYNDSESLQTHVALKREKIGFENADLQIKRAIIMSEMIREKLSSENYGEVSKVWWTARPGSLQQVIVDASLDNPTDILLQTEWKGFLGLSAKSTVLRGDIGFKNLGIGSLETFLNIRVLHLYHDLIQSFNLPKQKRKAFIRADPELQKKTRQAGSDLLEHIRDILFDSYCKLDPKLLREHFLRDWMNSIEINPVYWKITGHGKKKITATLFDPLKNEKIRILQTQKLCLQKGGKNSIIVNSEGRKIFKIRLKFESEPLATSIKLSGDP